MKLRLTDFDSNTYEDTDGSCELCMYTGMLDHPEYTFTTSFGESYTIEGWWSEWGFLYSFDVNVPVFTEWLHDAEFKDPKEIDGYSTGKHFWEEFLEDVLRKAQWCSTKEELNKELGWALKGTNNAD